MTKFLLITSSIIFVFAFTMVFVTFESELKTCSKAVSDYEQCRLDLRCELTPELQARYVKCI